MKRLKFVATLLLAFVLCSASAVCAFAEGDDANSSDASNADGGAVSYAMNGVESKSDPSTIDNWMGLLQKDTANVGRIWTDKSVSTSSIVVNGQDVGAGDSAFITALSVLSSTSNIASTATTPLDVVLVLDASGSMGFTMDKGSRLDALQTAANTFIDQIASQNEGISDASLQHQVSIVKFAGNKTDRVGNETYVDNGSRYNYSQVMKSMAPCTSDTSKEFKDQIAAIRPYGATRADNGLALAQGQTSGRDGKDGGVAAKKIVVFFTDGIPTKTNKFDNEVASSAVASAKTMKDVGASVYAVGIFDGVDPSAEPTNDRTSNENKFMQAVSSNYPSATLTKNGRDYAWGFGARAENSSFYKSATDADELKRVFEEISQEIVSGAGYPTKTTEGAELQSGYITFDDPLGAYMQVDDICAVAVNGTLYEGKTKNISGNVTTYVFSGSAVINGDTAPLNSIIMTVTKSDDAAVGDAVQVKVPAALIPLRNFQVDEDELTMSVTDTQPLSVLYRSSLKESVGGLLAKPDAAMADYLKAHSTTDGKATFLANQWNGADSSALGEVTASFEPSPKNSYYYFTRDVPIYEDQTFTKRATQVKAGETYWYKHDFYKMNGDGGADPLVGSISFPGEAAEAFDGAIGYDANGAYFKAGTARLTYIDDLHMEKDQNITATAGDALNPKWNDTAATSAATIVGSHLGNNGKLSVDVPGSLTVTKQIEVPEGYSLEDYADAEFSFALRMPEAASKVFAAEVTDAQGASVAGGITSLAFDPDGNATFKLKGGQTLHVYGFAADSGYTVLEGELAGWKQVGATGQEGRIVAGQTSEETFVNKYAASGNLGDNAFIGSKILTGREWTANDRFVFELKAASVSPDAPLPDLPVPEGVTPEAGSAYVEVTEEPGFPAGDHTDFDFGDITYTKPGTYTYEIWESECASSILPGVSPSQALYQVVVTVVDKEHNGKLTVTTEWKKLFDDSGKPVAKESQGETPGGAVFVNEYDASTVKWNPSGTKFYDDTTGAFGFTRGMFNVALCTNDAAAPLPPEGSAELIMAIIDGVPWRGVITAVEEGGSISFPQMKYGYTDLGKRFQYKIVEVVKDAEGNWVAVKDMTQSSAAIPGMTYDPTVWTANVSIAENDERVLELTAEYLKGDALTNGTMFSFRNTYEPTPAKVTVSGSKVLTGRDMLDGESFGFALVAVNDAAKSVLPESKQAEVSGLGVGSESAFNFDELTFTKPGTYLFKLYENAYDLRKLPADGISGIAFDRHECAVKVVVADDGSGALKAEVVYEGAGSVEGHPEQFVNRFADQVRYGDAGGLEVVKTLMGRDMVAGEFSFAIEGKGEASAALLTDADRSFANHARAAGGEDVMRKLSGVTFSAEDVGKTFAFKVSEVVPADDQKLAGVAYDENPMHEVEISVGVGANGHLLVTTKVDGRQVSVDSIDDQGKVARDGTARVAFVNAYKAGDASFDTATAGLRKVLEGRDWLDGDAFMFEIEALDDAPMPCDATGNEVNSVTVNSENANGFSFGTIAVTSDMVAGAPGRAKTFTYKVTEVEPATGKLPGVEYSTNVATIKVTVRDDGTGTLKVSSVTENGTFVNRYAAQLDYAAAGGLNVAKTLTGHDMAQDQFTMRVAPADEASAQALGMAREGRDVPMPAAADGQQVVVSVLGGDSVVFNQNDAGKTYAYTVTELGDAPAGYTYDKAERTVTITVSDDSYAGVLTVTTVVSGGPEGTQTFVYTSQGTPAAVAVAPFANSYYATTDVPGGTKASVVATKQLTGRPLEAGEFTFALKYASVDGDIATATNVADGTVAFASLSYDTNSLASLVKRGLATKSITADGKTQWAIPYVAYEKTDGLAAVGITAQTQPVPFAIIVVDNGDGTLAAAPNLGVGLVFKNVYATNESVAIDLAGAKALVRAEGLQPADITGKFAFTVASDNPVAPMPEHVSATNDAQGKVDFGSIEFTLDDLKRALGETSQIAPVVAAGEGGNGDALASNGPAQSGVGANTGNNEAGKASVDAVEPAEPSDLGQDDLAGGESAMVNGAAEPGAAEAGMVMAPDGLSADVLDAAATQATEATVSVMGVTEEGAGAVIVTDAVADETVVPAEGVANPSTNEAPVANTATANENAGQNGIATQTGKPRSHIFVYKVAEAGSVPGVTNDAASEKTVRIKVTDDGAGKLTAVFVDENGNTKDASEPAFEFANTYSVEPKTSSVTDQIVVTKILAGRSLVAGEFSFELLEGNQVVATGVNDASGNVVLNAIVYAEPGTHHYTLREVGAGTSKAGVAYDGASFAITTMVVDKGDGTLGVTHAVDGGRAVTFANVYQAQPASVTISATKALSGKNLEDGQFMFVLKANDGTEARAKNAADGTVAFPAMTFDKSGTYEFTLSELNDGQAGITYDARAYKVVVTVVDDGQGHLNASVQSDADVLAFQNTYVEEKPPVVPVASGGAKFSTTADGAVAVLVAGILVAVFAAGIGAWAVWTLRRHEKR